MTVAYLFIDHHTIGVRHDSSGTPAQMHKIVPSRCGWADVMSLHRIDQL